jgi:TolB-like protein
LKKQSYNLIHNILFVFFSALIIGNAAAAVAAPARVAILPFDMHAEKDLTFLQEGIMDMLGSRIAYQDQVEVISKSETRAALESVKGFQGESRALLIGAKLKADYVLFGSITVFGESVSIDAKMVDVTSQKPPLPFFAQTRGMADVIPQINQFATDINAAVFGRAAPQRTVAAAPPSTGVAPSPAIPAAPVVDPRMHPEKLLQSGVTSGTPPQTQGQSAGQPYQAPNPAFVAIEPVGGAGDNAPTYWKSRSFKTLINGLAIADVDNDGRQEAVIATEKRLSIYRMENGRLIKVAEKAETRTSTYIGVDVADINGNGTPEIYVSSLGPKRASVDSFVMEFDGTDYKTIHGSDNWFYRVAKTVDRGTILMGQRMRAAENSIFYNPIREMQWQGSDLVPATQLLKGGKANLMGATYGDVTQSGQSSMIAYSKADRLRIYSATGEEIWEDAERTGGNMTYYNLPKVDPGQENKQYFPLRVQTADIDRNGKTEVLVALHEELTNNMLRSFRQFSKARIECKEWNGLALASKWKTQEFSGRASDFVVGDIDNDGSDELVVAVVAKEGSIIMTDAVSSIIAFDLNPQ